MHITFLTRQPVLAVGVEYILRPHANFRSIIISEDQPDELPALRSSLAEILLIDFAPADDFPLLFRARREMPHLEIVIWSRKILPEIVCQLVHAGVKGVFLSSSSAQSLLECIAAVSSGATWFDKEVDTSLLKSRPAMLSPRETQLVIMVSQGLKNKEIATALGLSDSTVRMYMSALFRKVGVKDRYELAIYGARHLLGKAEEGAAAPDIAVPDPRGVRVMILERPASSSTTQERMPPHCIWNPARRA